MTDDKPPGDFDYGEQQADGQYENYPTIGDGDFVQSVQYTYVHENCGKTTTMSDNIAESVARDPHYYTKTFCANCGEHVPVEDVHWKADGQPWARDEIDQ